MFITLNNLLFALAVIFIYYMVYTITDARFDWRNSVGTVTFRFVRLCKDCGCSIEHQLQREGELYCSNCLDKP